MEVPCYKCGQAVDEGIPFCPDCAAPQIRVVIAQPAAALAGEPAGVAHAGPIVADSSSATESAVRPARVFRPCVLAAIAGSILVFLGLNFFVATLGAGFLSVVFYRQQVAGLVIKASAGARLGALSGLCFFACFALLCGAGAAVMGGAKAREQIYEGAQKWMAARASDPQMQAAFEQFKTPDGFIVAVIGGCLMLLVVCVILAGIGGSLGGMVFGSRNRT